MRRGIQEVAYMESIRVKDLMVPVNEYISIDSSASLFDAVMKLEEARLQYESDKCPHRAILVRDKSGDVLGKLNYSDVIRSLEPRYNELGDLRKLSGFGLSAEFLKSVMAKYELWKTPLADLCRKASDLKVGDRVFMPLEGELINDTDTLDKAVHKLILGHFQSLLVKSGDKVVGILRLVDVFREIATRMKNCKI
jgi:hypothetical protein